MAEIYYTKADEYHQSNTFLQVDKVPAKLKKLLLCPGPNSSVFQNAYKHNSYQLKPQLLEIFFSRRGKNTARFSCLPHQHPPSNMVRHTPPQFNCKFQTIALKMYFIVFQNRINCSILPLFPEKCTWGHVSWLGSMQIFHLDTLEMSWFNYGGFFCQDFYFN